MKLNIDMIRHNYAARGEAERAQDTVEAALADVLDRLEAWRDLDAASIELVEGGRDERKRYDAVLFRLVDLEEVPR